ncbi:PBSX family phage terminase large subunit [Sediminihabitans luteus]|uniref:PBSX family phage terminase large subunit n=1 Tax=Sediminihabitans luteus TaxID=1138585 RepID=A0A2M9CZW7_9CELL|nr:terminase family protein [Sediminihabitans luteus]PJJ77482.1 PBSX family phage terminase large subunit [Sediminihabitans luteus]GII98378.1 phage terminase large subunit [Sediminihabitans luteus]
MTAVVVTQAVITAVLAGLSPLQVWSIARSTARVNLWTGSIRSGKTIASLLRWVLYVARAPRGGELVVVGRTRESIARNVFGPLQDPQLFGMIARHVSYTAGAPTARILGRTIHVLGASDSRAENVLRGLTCAGAYVDEATLVSEAFWTQLLGRMSVPGAMLFATTNPDGPSHWLKKQVIDRAVELGYRVFRFRLTDNTHLPAEYVAQVSREYVGLWFRRFILGEWVQAAGAIFDSWDPARHVIPTTDLPPMDRVLAMGVDYGDQHATRGYLIGIGPDTRPGHDGEHRLYTLAEWAPGRMTIGEHSTDLRRWLASQPVDAWRTPEWVAVDSAASSFRHQLFHDGQPGVRNAHKAVLPGIRTLAGLLAVDKMVVADTCTHLIAGIPGYVWDEKATARGVDAPVKADDDEVDAWRYGIYTTRLDWTSLIPLAPALTDAPGDTTD